MAWLRVFLYTIFPPIDPGLGLVENKGDAGSWMDGSCTMDESQRKKESLRRRSEGAVTEAAVGRKGTCELMCLRGFLVRKGSLFVFHVPVSRSTSPTTIIMLSCCYVFRGVFGHRERCVFEDVGALLLLAGNIRGQFFDTRA